MSNVNLALDIQTGQPVSCLTGIAFVAHTSSASRELVRLHCCAISSRKSSLPAKERQ